MTAPAQVGPSPSGGGPGPYMDLEELVADIGDRVRAERQHRGWSQAELAERSGTFKRYVSLVECGTAALPITRLAQLCNGLGMSMSELLSDGWRLPPRKVPPPALTPRQAEVLIEARSGRPLSQIAERVGIPRTEVSSRLSEVYRLLDVSHLPRAVRREAAVRAALERGLLQPAQLGDAA